MLNMARLIAALFFILTATVGSAQQIAEPELITDALPEAPVVTEPDWDSLASRAELVLSNGQASLFALTRLREQLFTWRETFDDAGSVNAGRIGTVRAQIDALGVVPESGEEPTQIADRRAELEGQLAELRVPVMLARESFARADGLISEIDVQLRGRDAAALTERGPTLFDPTLWAGAVDGAGTATRTIWAETALRLQRQVGDGSFWRALPGPLVILGLAWLLVTRGRQWSTGLAESVATSDRRGRSVIAFLFSLWEVILPLLGLYALSVALERLGVLGTGGTILMEAVVYAGFVILTARWLARRFFPVSMPGPLRHPVEANAGLRRATVFLGWGMALLHIINQLMAVTDVSASIRAAAIFPVQVLLSIVLFQFGRRIRQMPDESLEGTSAGRLRGLIGSATMVIAIAAPILAAFGFSSASDRLFEPAVLTLGILGGVVLLQRLVHDIWLIWTDPENETGALAPVLIGFGLFLISLPILALVWGARVSDLQELWARFQQGFTIGESSLSPTDFLLFVMVFVVGYVLTRLIQGGLRQSVLPRTKLDQGGQDAVVAGVGYVGILLAALAAINSAGVDLSNIALVAGALSVGIGFGLQTVVSNFVSGIILLIERPVSGGDWIEVNGQTGIVKDISVRSTRIETFDRTDVIIPNADLISGSVTNWTRGNSIGRVIVPVGVAYGTDVDRVIEILREIAEAHPAILPYPRPSVLFQAFGASSLDFEIRAIIGDVNSILSIKSELNQEIAKRFEAEGIEVPFPQTDVWMRTSEGET